MPFLQLHRARLEELKISQSSIGLLILEVMALPTVMDSFVCCFEVLQGQLLQSLDTSLESPHRALATGLLFRSLSATHSQQILLQRYTEVVRAGPESLL